MLQKSGDVFIDGLQPIPGVMMIVKDNIFMGCGSHAGGKRKGAIFKL